MITRWLVRVAVAELLVIVLLSVWLWDSRREPEDVLVATREYVRARQDFDTSKAIRTRAVHHYRTLRDSLTLTDTVEVVRVLAAADTVMVRDSAALAAADAALAKADTRIAALRKVAKPRIMQPFAEILYSPYAKEYVGRGGLEIRTVRNLSLVVAGEARKEGPQGYVGVRLVF